MFPLYCSRQRVQGEARLALIFLARCVIWDCCALWLLAPSGSPCGVLRGAEGLVCALDATFSSLEMPVDVLTARR